MLDIGDTEDLQCGKTKLVTVSGKSFILARAADGTYYAIKNLCPHQGVDMSTGKLFGRFLPSEVGEYKYLEDFEVIRCPRHGWEFDVKTGCSFFDPGHVRIKTYPVQIMDDRLFVDL
jgi:nitrite reductase (NADH) small subunit